MVRLKNGENSDDKDKNADSNYPNGDGYVEDDEGNHECHNHGHGLRQENSNGLEHIVRATTPPIIAEGLNMTPTIGNLELNHFAALGASIYQGEWPISRALWMSGPSSIGEKDSLSGLVGDDTESIMSFSSSTAAGTSHSHSHHLGSKVEMVYSLLSMLGSSSKDDMSKTLLEMSHNRESCIAMRQSGCLPLLVQLLHGTDHDYILSEQDPNSLRWALREARRRAGQALHNIVYAHPDDKRGRREARVLRLLEQIRDYSDYLKDVRTSSPDVVQNENLDLHPGPAIAALMKLSFDEEHRHAMCLLGGLQAIAELIQADHEVHGNTNDQFCITVRRYAGMALTNLTFGDGTNKALLCSMKSFMQALVAQLHSPNEDLRQVTASVLRNLSWRADSASKQILREVGAVTTLMKISMQTSKESTLKSILSALWNLSAHCSVNKADICAIDGALEFLVSTLTYKSTLKTLSIVENGGGILRNISSHIAVKEEYRAILRKHNCLQTLLRHLKSPSLTVVSNACGTLWNLSARCQQDQQALWEMGAVGMLRNLIHSKHKMISMGSAAALKNLLAARPPGIGFGLGNLMENSYHQPGSQSNSPSLFVRKQRALEADLDQNLSETCDNIDSPKTSPTSSGHKRFNFESNGIKPHYLSYLPGRMYHSINGHVTSPLYVPRSESRDSLGSTQSEPPHYRAQCERFRILVNANRQVPLDLNTVPEKPVEKEKNNLDFTENTNIVMQLFKSLHENPAMISNSQSLQMPQRKNGTSVHNNLGAIKMGIWEVPNTEGHKLGNINAPLQNGIRHDNSNQNMRQLHINKNDLDLSRNRNHMNSSSQLKYTENHQEKNRPFQMISDLNSYLEFPENKRPHNKDTFQHNSLQNSNSFKPVLFTEHLMNHEKLENNSTDHCQSNNDVIQENSTAKIHMDTIQENVVLRKKTKSNISHWSSTSTLKEPDSDDTDQTPLAASRCSSLSSLASCLQQSARSSWISDVSSRRTSGIISPSDIPDSPSDMKHCVSRFTDKAPDAESLGIPRPRPAWPLGLNLGSNNTQASFIEISYSDKSSPKLNDKEKKVIAEKKIELENVNENSTMDWHRIKDNAFSTNLGIPNNNDTNMEHNNSKLHSRVNNLSASFSCVRSNIPVKSNNIRLTQSVPNVSRSTVLSSCATAILVSESKSFTEANLERNTLFQRSQHYQFCDDNDNLLIRYRNCGTNKINTSVQPDTSQTLLYWPLLKNPAKNIEFNESKIASQSNKYGFRRYSPRCTESKNQQSILRTLYNNSTENLQRNNSDHGNAQFVSLNKNFTITKPLINQMNQENSINDISSQERRKGKQKTSIPQIIRPWHSSTDNEVHPKQLQIMSQNLPVYKGLVSSHGDSSKVKTENNDFFMNQDRFSQSTSRIDQPSDNSSPSADSELSSTELLQECILAAKVSKINRNKAKRNKQANHPSEIKVHSDHSSDDGDKIAEFENKMKLAYITKNHWYVTENGVDDKTTQEKNREFILSANTVPDLLEGAACHADIVAKKGLEGMQIINLKPNELQKSMSDSAELRKGAFLIATELEELADDQTHSSASCFSDLDNIKPPSVMGEMSMTSSGLSDLLSNGNGKCYLNGKTPPDRRRSLKRIKKVNGGHRFVFKSVLQSRDISRSGESSDKPSSIAGSIENLSMKSSGTSEILDNINPPSVMDDISMTNSCASLNSINSDILESRSQSLADPRSDSEMFQRLNAAAAMVQVYSRELNNIMTGSMKSSYNSDNLDQVKPPSVFQDIAEVTVEDGTEVGSDAMISDSELEEELPHDDEGSVPSTETVHSPMPILSRTDHTEGSTENLNSSFESDSLYNVEKPHSIKKISNLALTPQNMSIINMNSNTVQHSINSLAQSENTSKIVEQSNLSYLNSDQTQFNSLTQNCDTNLKLPPVPRSGPRIVKPINRETIRQMQEKKANEKQTLTVRGKVPVTSKTTPRNVIRSGITAKSVTSRKGVSLLNSVRPTKTSVLRASQSQKQTENKSSNGRFSPRSFLSKPPVVKVTVKNTKCNMNSNAKSQIPDQAQAVQKPSPPVKQGTFTKEEPTQNVPLISPHSDDSNNIPDFNESKCRKVDIPYSATSNISSGLSKSVTSKSVLSSCNNTNTKEKNSETFKRSSSNYTLQRNISLPLQKKENSKTSLRLSPSTQSFGNEKDTSSKMSDSNSSKSSTFTRNTVSSFSSNGWFLKRTNSQKEVTSKISAIWKKSESTSSSVSSPVTDNSISEKIASSVLGKSKPPSSKVVSGPHSTTSNTYVSQDNQTSYKPQLEKTRTEGAILVKHRSFIKSVPSNSRTTPINSTRTVTNSSYFKKNGSTVKTQSTSSNKIVNNSTTDQNSPSSETSLHRSLQTAQKDISAKSSEISPNLHRPYNQSFNVKCAAQTNEMVFDNLPSNEEKNLSDANEKQSDFFEKKNAEEEESDSSKSHS